MRAELRSQKEKPMRRALVRRPLDGVEGDDAVGQSAEEAPAAGAEEEGLVEEGVAEDADGEGQSDDDHQTLVDRVDALEVQAARLVSGEVTAR